MDPELEQVPSPSPLASPSLVTSPSPLVSPSPSPSPSPTTLGNMNVGSPGDEMDDGDAMMLATDPALGKRKRTSQWWDHFNELLEKCEIKAKCKYCGKILSGNARNGTSHLTGHIESACPRRLGKKAMDDIRQMVLNANFKASGKADISCSSFDEKASRHEWAVATFLHDYPLSMVEHFGRRRFVKSLNPNFKTISRNTLKSDIMKIYEAEKTKAYRLMDKLECRIAITTDMWTSNNNRKDFMAVTAHYIDEDWNLQDCILSFLYVPAPHTAEALCDELSKALMDWNIDRKLSTITVDNCSTNDAMLDLRLERLSHDDMLLEGQVLHMRCCAHILNIIVQHGLEKLGDRILEKIRNSVVFWSATPKRNEKSKDAARQLKIDCSRELVVDCKTRWNSIFFMLETAIIYEKVFERVDSREKTYKTCPTEDDWELAKDIFEKLKIFYKVTEMFYGRKYPTSNWYFPKICMIRKRLHEWSKSKKDKIREMAEAMLEFFLKYWDVVHVMMVVAAVLDPRFKMTLIEFHFPEIYNDGAKLKIAEVCSNCYMLLRDYQSRKCSKETSSNKASDSSLGYSGIGASNANNASRTMNKEDEEYNKFVQSQKASSVSLTAELDHYLEEAVLPFSADFDVLGWWKTQGVKFPYLRQIARDVLAIPVSTVASESAFSTSGRLLSPHRSRLHHKTLEALMCTRRWLWNTLRSVTPVLGHVECCPTTVDEEQDVQDQDSGFIGSSCVTEV